MYDFVAKLNNDVMFEDIPIQVLELVAMHKVLAGRIQNLPSIKQIMSTSRKNREKDTNY